MPNIVGMDSNSCPVLFETMEAHVRLWAASPILLYKLHKIGGRLRLKYEAGWPLPLLGD